MKLRKEQARNFLKQIYPGLKIVFRPAGKVTFANVPVVDQKLGVPVLAWRFDANAGYAYVGPLNGGAINWDWQPKKKEQADAVPA